MNEKKLNSKSAYGSWNFGLNLFTSFFKGLNECDWAFEMNFDSCGSHWKFNEWWKIWKFCPDVEIKYTIWRLETVGQQLGSKS